MTVRSLSDDMDWDHNVDLDDNFCLFWKVKDRDIIFEMQVKSLGYVGFGFARSEFIYGSDMVVGWIDSSTKHVFFQVSITKFHIFLKFMINEIRPSDEESLWLVTKLDIRQKTSGNIFSLLNRFIEEEVEKMWYGSEFITEMAHTM